MYGSLSKYWNTRTDSQGNRLYWPGTAEGYPVRAPGGAPPVRQGEYERTPTSCDARGRIFELPREMDAYLDVVDRCANGLWVLRMDQFLEWDSAGKTMYRFVQWLELYGEVASHANDY